MSNDPAVRVFVMGAIQNRADVLVYTTQPLEKPVEVTGPITVTLYAASSAKDTDFTAKLRVSHAGHEWDSSVFSMLSSRRVMLEAPWPSS